MQHYDRLHPHNAPKLSYKVQPGAVYDTEVEAAEEYLTETDEYIEVERGVSSAAKESEDDFIMDDGE